MQQPIPLSFNDEECQEDMHVDGGSQSPRYGTINGSHHSKSPKRSSVKVTLTGHQPCHQLEVSRRSSSNSNVTTESQLNRRALFYDEMTSMVKLAVPVTLTYILEMFPGIITILLVGRAEFDEEESSLQVRLDAAALAVMFMNVVALSPGFGMLTALDTLCSQGKSTISTFVWFIHAASNQNTYFYYSSWSQSTLQNGHVLSHWVGNSDSIMLHK